MKKVVKKKKPVHVPPQTTTKFFEMNLRKYAFEEGVSIGRSEAFKEVRLIAVALVAIGSLIALVVLAGHAGRLIN